MLINMIIIIINVKLAKCTVVSNSVCSNEVMWQCSSSSSRFV